MRFVLALVLAALSPVAGYAQETAVPASAAVAGPVTPMVGKMLYSTGGKKLAPVYKLNSAGAPQILIDGKLITVPVATLTAVDGRVETSLTRKDLLTRL